MAWGLLKHQLHVGVLQAGALHLSQGFVDSLLWVDGVDPLQEGESAVLLRAIAATIGNNRRL